MVYFNLNQRETSKFQFHRFTNEMEEIKLASFLTVLPTGRAGPAPHGVPRRPRRPPREPDDFLILYYLPGHETRCK